MSKKRIILIYAMIGVVVSLLLGVWALTRPTDSITEMAAYISAIAASVSIILAFITLNNRRSYNNVRQFIYISTPFNMSESSVSKIKETFKGLPVFYTDDVIQPGDRIQKTITSNLKNVHYCFMILSGDLTPRQKSEIKELKHNGAKITPVLDGDDTKLPPVLQDYQPISLERFLLMGRRPYSLKR